MNSCIRIILLCRFSYTLSKKNINIQLFFQKTVTRKKSPYTSDCTDVWSSTNYTDIVPSDWGYTLKVSYIGIREHFWRKVNCYFLFLLDLCFDQLQLCQRTCIHSMITTDCGCFHPFYMDHPDWEGDYAPCNLTDSREFNFFASK